MLHRTRWTAERHRFNRRLAVNEAGPAAVQDWSEGRAYIRAFLQVNNPGFPIPDLELNTQDGQKLQAGKWPVFMLAYLYDPCKGTNACFKLFTFLYRNGMAYQNAKAIVNWWWDHRPQYCDTSSSVADSIWGLAERPLKMQYAFFRTRIWDMALGACTCFPGTRYQFEGFVYNLEDDIDSLIVRDALTHSSPWRTPRPFNPPPVENPGQPPYYLPILPQQEEEDEGDMGNAPPQEEAPIIEDMPPSPELPPLPVSPPQIHQEEPVATLPLEQEPPSNQLTETEREQALARTVDRLRALQRSKRSTKRQLVTTRDMMYRESRKPRIDVRAQRELHKTSDSHKRRLVELENIEEPLLQRYFMEVNPVVAARFRNRYGDGEHLNDAEYNAAMTWARERFEFEREGN